MKIKLIVSTLTDTDVVPNEIVCADVDFVLEKRLGFSLIYNIVPDDGQSGRVVDFYDLREFVMRMKYSYNIIVSDRNIIFYE